MDIVFVGKLLSEHVPGIIILDEKEKIVFADNVVKKASGEKKIVSSIFSDVFPFSINQIKTNHKIYTSITKRKYFVRIKYLKDKDKDVNYIFVFFEEITNMCNAKSRLYCLEKIMDSIDDGVIVSDYLGRIVFYNSSQQKMEEMSSKYMVGKYLWEAYNYDPKMSEHRKVYKTGKPLLKKYSAHAYKNGIPKYVSYDTYPVYKEGEIIAVYSISKNEAELQSLLSDVLEIKKELQYKKDIIDNKKKFINGTTYTFADIIGESSSIKNIIREAQTAALLDSPVLIIGETGTGKELFAQSIHNFSKNYSEPFIAINCSAIPESLLESIFFGAVKGAYTGAVDQDGLFKIARSGTLFLDEINTMPLALQSKLLRVLQEKKIRKVGGQSMIPVSCRIICATSEDPQILVTKGKLRQDLFYRIARICIFIPPLRERKDDILFIAKFFIRKYKKIMNKRIESLSFELKNVMISHNWPGNVRELELVIENLMIKASDNQVELTLDNMPYYLKRMIFSNTLKVSLNEKEVSLPSTLRNIEKKIILESLNKNKWNLVKTAKDLGIIRQSLEYRLKKLSISKTN